MLTTVRLLVQKGGLITENSNAARLLHRAGFGALLSDGRVQLSLFEAVYLLEKGQVQAIDSREKILAAETVLKRSGAKKEFLMQYTVFRDLRSRGYRVKTGLKFGSDFRVYDKRANPEEHARWIVFVVHERDALSWQVFSAKNRVAHNARKNLLIAVVDDEGEVSYWESRWIRP